MKNKARAYITKDLLHEYEKEGFTRQEMARILGVSTNTIQKTFSGERVPKQKVKEKRMCSVCGKKPVRPGNYFFCYSCFANIPDTIDQDFINFS